MRQANDYGNIENRKSEKNYIQKWWKRFVVLMYFIFSWVIIYSFLIDEDNVNKSGEINYKDFIFIDFANMNTSTLDVFLYYIVGFLFLLFVWVMFAGESRLELEDKMEYKFKNKKPSISFTIKYKIVSFLDTITFYMFYPVSITFIPIDASISYNRNRFFIRYGWLSHLEYSFFKQKVKLVDGYTRVKELEHFKAYPVLFSRKKIIESAMCDPMYRATVNLFRSNEKMKDIFMISEGYMRDSMPKYDKYLDAKETKKRLKERFQNKLDNFRLYDGRDEICFSFYLIKRLIDEESENFVKYMRKYALSSSGLQFSREYAIFEKMLKKDEENLKMLKELPCPTSIVDRDMTEEEFVERIIFLFEIYFRFCAIFYIINQYINLPAGTVVVRIKDYNLRMISEIYENKCLVSIEPRKNDGTTKSFKGDALVNMFLLSWNYYNYTVENSFQKRVYNIFNFRDEDVDSQVSKLGENDSNANYEEIQGYIEKEVPEDISIDDESIENMFIFKDDG